MPRTDRPRASNARRNATLSNPQQPLDDRNSRTRSRRAQEVAKSQRPIEAAALQVLSLGLGAPLRNALAVRRPTGAFRCRPDLGAGANRKGDITHRLRDGALILLSVACIGPSACRWLWRSDSYRWCSQACFFYHRQEESTRARCLEVAYHRHAIGPFAEAYAPQLCR